MLQEGLVVASAMVVVQLPLALTHPAWWAWPMVLAAALVMGAILGALRPRPRHWTTSRRLAAQIDENACSGNSLPQQILANDARYRALVEDADLIVWEYAVESRQFTYVSPRAADLGYSISDWMTPDFWPNHIHAQDRDAALQFCESQVRAGVAHRVQYRMVTASGREVWMDDFVSSPERVEGRTTLRGVMVDITERKLAEAHAAEAAERTELALLGGNLGSWDWDVPTGRVVYDRRWAEMLGHKPGDLTQTFGEWQSRVHPDDLQPTLAEVHRHLAGDTCLFKSEQRLRHRDGSWRWIASNGRVVMRDAAGNPLRMVGTHLDVTEERAAREELERRDARQAATSRMANIGWWELDLITMTLLWSDQVRKVHEVDAGFEPSLDKAIAFYAGDAAERIDACVRGAIDHRRSFDVELPLVTAKGRRIWVRSQGEAVVEHGTVVKLAGAFQDVTEQVAARDEAQAASRSKTEFLANMSHEIRTPMTAILGYTELLADDGDRDATPARRLGYIETIRRNGEHLLAIINDILDISKIEAGRLTIESIAMRPVQAIDQVIALMAVKANAKNLRLTCEYQDDLPETIHSDPLRLRQILVNLIGNAIKFTDVGGVSVVVARDAANPEVLRISIRDTGIGMTASQIPRLFAAFVQADASTSRRFGGTGLGLKISRHLAQMLGGNIEVASEPGKGSVFTLSISTGSLAGVRRINAADARERSEMRRGAMASGQVGGQNLLRGARILLVEDGADNRRLIVCHLNKAGAQVHSVENGKLAVEALTSDGTLAGPILDPAPFDLVLTDMQMPEMDGYTAAKLLRAKGSRLPIIALTAHAMSGDAERCIQAGCDGYATKPIDRVHLIEVCAAALRGDLVPHNKAA